MDTPLKVRKRMPPAERRRHLLNCAVKVFARRGLGRATHAEVAAEAGVSVATAFTYFPTRPALVEAVLAEIDRFLTEMVEASQSGADDARGALEELGHSFLAALENHPDHVRVWLDWSTAIRDVVWDAYLDFQRRVVARVARTIREDVRIGRLPAAIDAEDAAELFVGEAHMASLMHFSGTAPQRIRRLLDRAAVGALTPLS